MSTVLMEAWVLAMLPSVEPPGMSERFAKRCTGTPARAQTPSKIAWDTPSLVYFWLALNFTTTPPFMATRLSASYFSGWFGWTAWALSAESIMLRASMASRLRAPRAAATRPSTSRRKLESAP